MQSLFRKCLVVAVVSIFCVTVHGQKKKRSPAPAPVTKEKAASATTNPPSPSARSGPKPYKDVITSKAISSRGLFTVHKIEDRYLFEIPDTLFGRDLLIVGRISKGGADIRGNMLGYGGDQINEALVRFEKGPNNRIFLKTPSYSERAFDTSSNGMFRSLSNSSLLSIAAAFEIKAYHYTDTTEKLSDAAVIDLTDFLSGDNEFLYFSAPAKANLKLSSYQADKSYVADVRSFPTNIEIRAVKTYTRSAAGGSSTAATGAKPGNATLELNSSIVLLPEKPMQPRYYDDRVGYFNTGFVDYDANPHGIKRVSLITRWRLEPKPEDMEKYKRGELVEPAKPIIFYIDPNAPKIWVPYLIQGVEDWRVAFEKAGFKNAISAKEAPVDDPEWSLDDARHSAIVYKPSDIPNASGPHVHDPRSGEILESHINWYHNVMEVVRNWYLIQAGASDPRAQKLKFDDELMGQLIRFVSSHEVGHTLGLRHNFGASSTVPVEKLRDKVPAIHNDNRKCHRGKKVCRCGECT